MNLTKIIEKYFDFLDKLLTNKTNKIIIIFHLFIFTNIIAFIAGFVLAYVIAYQIVLQVLNIIKK